MAAAAVAECSQCAGAAAEELAGSPAVAPVPGNQYTAAAEELDQSLSVAAQNHWAVVADPGRKAAAVHIEDHRGGHCWPRPGMSLNSRT